MYFIKTPGWLKKIYNNYVWHLPGDGKTLYLTFDDGPHPVATPFVLDELRKYNAKATFFCIGKNVLAEPEIYKRTLQEGHSVGNHTHNHLNGWKTADDIYIANITLAANAIQSNLYRPPYGRIKTSQGRTLRNAGYKVIMWDVLSGDFDRKITAEKCSNHVILKSQPGSVIVFHDSEKAFTNMSFALQQVLKFFSDKGFQFKGIEYKKGPE